MTSLEEDILVEFYYLMSVVDTGAYFYLSELMLKYALLYDYFAKTVIGKFSLITLFSVFLKCFD